LSVGILVDKKIPQIISVQLFAFHASKIPFSFPTLN
jgi:hypothetical protein